MYTELNGLLYYNTL